ncbi:hypothetical protein K438DRAFT_1953637 [Mycena galopus ATCC 62051]|nr:hypothetical protein K438DRAFT_1953637 [Mycena galopus ATCC 62051]
MSTPPAKRQRAEDASNIIRSETWRSDGNVVLQAGNTQFRVHWSVLALHSSVFCDMQGLPQPPEQPNVDGCPIAELPDDAGDVEYLLKALYTPTFLSQKTLPLPAVGALIRLGRKYDFKDLFDSAVARLMSEFPTTLEEYDTLPDMLKTITPYWGVDLDIIAMASENNISLALPSAYWRVVCGSSLNGLFDIISKADGTVASLPLPDLRRCVVGRQNLLLIQFKPGYEDCIDLSKCRQSREFILKALDYAFIWALKWPSDFRMYKFCAACTEHIQECMTAGRKKMWGELPQIFDLPPWAELRNDI